MFKEDAELGDTGLLYSLAMYDRKNEINSCMTHDILSIPVVGQWHIPVATSQPPPLVD